MRAWTLLASLLLTFAVVMPSWADGQKKDDDKTPPATKKKDDAKKPDKKQAQDKKAKPKKADDEDQPEEKPEKKEKLRLVGSFMGRLRAIDNQGKKLVVAVPISHLAGDIRNAHIDTNWPEVTVYLGDDLTVRRYSPPPAMDERGRPKRYTSKELKEMRGPKGSWRFRADFDDLKPEQFVEVFLGRHKGPTHQGRLNTKQLQKELANPDNRPVVFKIYILRDTLSR